MDKLQAYHPPEADTPPVIRELANVPELRIDHVEVQIDPLSEGERFLANLDDDALNELAAAMALKGIPA